MFASLFCLFVKSPGTLSSRAALLDIFETMCRGAFLAELGDHRGSLCPAVRRLTPATAIALERLTLGAMRHRVQ
jgi:hypothetical protein